MQPNLSDAQRLHWSATGPCEPWLPNVQQQDDASRAWKESKKQPAQTVPAATM